MPRAYISSEKTRTVIARAQNRCEYCQSPAEYATDTFAVDHIRPVSRGGTNDLDNLALACTGCNGRKYNKQDALDPAGGELVSLFDPRSQNWTEHFCWSEDYSRILGLTPTGRATVEALQLNRIGVVNIRKVLFLIDKHPPDLRYLQSEPGEI
ncbi:MAG: HNH endonuclease [Anaerolineae bacterium]|nr:HNH endonuclease [Anaerolineae bacterium]